MVSENDLAKPKDLNDVIGTVTNIQKYCIHDGPGIRTTVFLKGCMLRCPWCCNPECMNGFAEIGFTRSLCNACGDCVEVCPEEAISLGLEGKRIDIDRSRCMNCGKCTEVCFAGALKLYGRKVSASEVFKEVLGDKPFYRTSGGGLTVSGGESLLQYKFVKSLLELARQAGINTAIETCGYVNPRVFEDILKLTDYVLFDLKLMDSQTHNRIIGKPNERIVQNAKTLPSSGCAWLFRMPLIPGVNESEENIAETSQFLRSIGSPVIELMPFHRFAEGKYEGLGRVYVMKDVLPPSGDQIEKVKEQFHSFGIDSRVSI